MSKNLPVSFNLARFQMRPDHGGCSTCISCMQGSRINSKLLLCCKLCGFKKYQIFPGLENQLYYESVDLGCIMGLKCFFKQSRCLFFSPVKGQVTLILQKYGNHKNVSSDSSDEMHPID